jgi:hypothetical protein
MDSSSRVKLLTAVLAMAFVGSIIYLIVEGNSRAATEEEQKAALSKPASGKKGSSDDRPRCPECGRELPYGADCPFCLMKKQQKGEGKSETNRVPRFGRYLAWTFVGFTALLAAVHLGIYWRSQWRTRSRPEEVQLKTKCPYCKRKVRFAARLAGTYGSCPTCRNRIRFDPLELG